MQTRLLAFIEALRQTGLTITVAETLDAVRAVGAVGVERQPFREALAAALVKDEADRVAFDAVFDRFFAAPGRQRGKGTRPQPNEQGDGRGAGRPGTLPPLGPPADSPRRAPHAPHTAERRHQPDAHARQLEASRTQSLRARLLQSVPFQEMSPQQIEACEALVAELARRFRAHLSRRLRAGDSGRMDVRRTLRRSISMGGVPLHPVFRRRRPGRPDLVGLCDYSHSVVTAANFLLALLAPAQEFLRRVRLFAFVDHPVEISLERGRLIPHERLDLYARSDFGRVLVEFWDRYEPVLTRNTILLVLGDARNNRRPPRADVLARIHSIVRQVVWVNPEPRVRWNSGDSVMQTYEPCCDTLIAASNLNELSAALKEMVRR